MIIIFNYIILKLFTNYSKNYLFLKQDNILYILYFYLKKEKEISKWNLE